ncbi:MAG: hypothetical protein LW692_06785 [Sphingobacteriales bacterium]|nr:hypothetical protein [Sphingobacteriales bacterium]
MEKKRTFFEKVALYTARHLMGSENKRGEMKYGYNNVRWISKNFNRLKNFNSHRKRKSEFATSFNKLLAENGNMKERTEQIQNGWLDGCT